jgi:hypothetical protein
MTLVYQKMPAHRRGDTWNGFTVSVSTPDGPLDLTGAAVLVQLRKKPDLPVVAQWSSDDAPATITISAATVTILPRVLAVESGEYVLDVQITLADDTVRTVFAAILPVEADVSRA